MLTENLDTFLQDFGVTVVWNTVSGTGVLDAPDQIAGDIALSTDYSLLAKTANYGGANHGDPITVDGENYQVRDVRKIDDGKFVRISLSKVE